MTELFVGIIVGCALTIALALLLKARAMRRNRVAGVPGSVSVHASIEDIRAIGELSVLKVITKEIVTAKDHWLGEWGKKYLEWLASSKKMAMIFEFDILFRYDLRSPEFVIKPAGAGSCRFILPKCAYDIHIRDIIFYDEQKARFLPWLIPELLTSVFGGGFGEEDRNRLKEEARRQAESMARGLVRQLQSEVQSSARETLKILAKGFSADTVIVEFSDSKPEQGRVDYKAEEKQSAPA